LKKKDYYPHGVLRAQDLANHHKLEENIDNARRLDPSEGSAKRLSKNERRGPEKVPGDPKRKET